MTLSVDCWVSLPLCVVLSTCADLSRYIRTSLSFCEALTLSLSLNGVVTDVLKIAVGRYVVIAWIVRWSV